MNQGKPSKILVAEDEPDIRILISFTLRFDGHTVVEAANGEEAVELTSKHLPDLVLLDVRMPRRTGYEACRLIKADPITQHIPVVFLSAKGQESEIATGLEAGAEEYLLKPFMPDQLTDRINEILLRLGLGIYQGPGIETHNGKSNFDFLIDEIKQLRKEKADLLIQLRKSEEESDQSRAEGSSTGRLPLEELSRITDGIVHDMRNGLGIIRNTIGFMSDDLKVLLKAVFILAAISGEA